MGNRLFSKPLFWTNLFALILFGLAAADVMFGWTNPSSAPPNPPGAVLADGSGNVAIGTTTFVSGTKLTVDGKISGLTAPTAGWDAANKAYVDAQAGGSGGGFMVTLWGVGPVTLQAASAFRGPISSIPPGCRTNLTLCGQILATWGRGALGAFTPSSPGAGTPACSSLSPISGGTWMELMAGYGPHQTVVQQFAQNTNPPGPGTDPNHWSVDDYPDTGPVFNEDSIASQAVGIASTQCSSVTTTYVNVVNSAMHTGASFGVSSAFGHNSACTIGGCNTCRVCVWVPN